MFENTESKFTIIKHLKRLDGTFKQFQGTYFDTFKEVIDYINDNHLLNDDGAEDRYYTLVNKDGESIFITEPKKDLYNPYWR